MKKTFAIIPVLLIAVFWLSACEEAPNSPDGIVNYKIEAILVKYLSSNTARIDVALTKNGDLYNMAEISLAGFRVITCSDRYCLVFGTDVIKSDTSYTLSITDSTTLDIDLTLTVPGDLTAEVTDLPPNRIYSGGSVNVDWTVSSGTDGYILATIPPDTIAADSGYEAYVSGTSGAIPPEALNFNQLLMRGRHDVYTVAFTGAPSDADGVPFEIPVANNPPDSIFSSRLSGRIAAMVIALPDSIIVSSQ